MEECHSRQLRPKTMLSYEHTLKLFSFWLTGRKKISKIEDIKEKHIREYIIELQTRGKYTVRPSGYEQNFPENRKKQIKDIVRFMDISTSYNIVTRLREFEQIRDTAKERKKRVSYVNQWFRSEFPNYDNVPEFDENLRIVHNPNAA